MNPLLADPAEFAALLQRFFVERLLQQQAVSARTVAAYRDTFRLLLGYAERQARHTARQADAGRLQRRTGSRLPVVSRKRAP